MAEVEGMAELLKALDECALNLSEKRKLIVKSLRAAAEPIEEDYKFRIPVVTGRALASVSTSVVDQTAEGAEAQIGPRLFYPKFEELGTVFITADPALQPAFDNNEEKAHEIIAKILGDGIEETYRHG